MLAFPSTLAGQTRLLLGLPAVVVVRARFPEHPAREPWAQGPRWPASAAWGRDWTDDLADVPPDGAQHGSGHVLGNEVPSILGAGWVRSANIPTSETKPGQMTDAPTPVPSSSARSPLVQAMRPALVAA